MNWKKIKKKHPKAWELFCKRYSIDLDVFWKITDDGELLDTDYETSGYFDERLLYDFFDEQGIYIEIIPRCNLKEICFEAVGLKHEPSHRYSNADEFLFDDYEYLKYKTRPEAESAAFERAFKILESN